MAGLIENITSSAQLRLGQGLTWAIVDIKKWNLFLAPPWFRWQNKILFKIKPQLFLSQNRSEASKMRIGQPQPQHNQLVKNDHNHNWTKLQAPTTTSTEFLYNKTPQPQQQPNFFKEKTTTTTTTQYYHLI